MSLSRQEFIKAGLAEKFLHGGDAQQLLLIVLWTHAPAVVLLPVADTPDLRVKGAILLLCDGYEGDLGRDLRVTKWIETVIVIVLHKKALLRLLPKWRAPDMQNQTTGVRAYRRITPFRLHLTSGDRYSIYFSVVVTWNRKHPAQMAPMY